MYSTVRKLKQRERQRERERQTDRQTDKATYFSDRFNADEDVVTD